MGRVYIVKKKLLIALGLTGIIIASVAVGAAYASSDIRLLINGKQINSDIQIIDGSSYVPLRVVSESLGANVKWDGDSRTISITSGNAVDAPKSDAKSYNVDINIENGPMKMKISKVTLDPAYQQSSNDNKIKAIVMDVNVENTSDDTIRWYPTQGKLALNTKEQIESPSFKSDRVDGEFVGKIIKTGKIVFEVKGDLDTITSFNYVISGAQNKQFSRVGEDKTTEVILK